MQAWRGARRAAAGASGKPPTFDPPSSSQPPPGTPCCVATVGLADAASAASAEVRLWRPSADDATLLVPFATPLRVHSGAAAAASPPTALAVWAGAWPRATVAVGGRDGRVTLLTFAVGASAAPARLAVPGRAGSGGGSGDGGVTGLAFCVVAPESGECAAPATPPVPSLLVATPDDVASIDIKSGGRTPVDGAGGESGKVAAAAPTRGAGGGPFAGGGLAVARSEAVYLYDGDGRGACFALAGEKAGIAWMGGCVAVAVARATGAADAGAGASTSTPRPPTATDVLVFDPRRRLIAASLALDEPPLALAPVRGGGAVVGVGGRVTLLTPRPLAARLATLASRGEHDAALSLAAEEGAPMDALASLRRGAGDAALARRDAAAAAAHYAAAVDAGDDPAHAVRALLDGDRVAELATFLQTVVARAARAGGGAAADHTTLLVACLCATRDGAALDAFLDAAAPVPGPPALDARAAYDACRAAGFGAAARRIAESAGEPVWVVDSLMDAPDADADGAPDGAAAPGTPANTTPAQAAADRVLAYAATLDRPSAAAVAARHGRALLAARPEPATALFMRLTTPDGDAPPALGVGEAARLYAARPGALALLCEFVLNSAPPSSPPTDPALWHTLLRLYLAPPPQPPTPAGGSASPDPPLAPRVGAGLALLARGWPPGQPPAYDPGTALVLARACAGDARPAAFLLERCGLRREVVAAHAAAGNAGALVDAAIGDSGSVADAGLLGAALDALAGMDASAVRPALPRLLAAASATGALPPIVVLQALAKVPGLTLGDVRSFVGAALAADGARAAADSAEADRLRADAERLRAEAVASRTRPRLFQAARCAGTGAPLDVPAVHFFCGHSFNAAALGDAGGGAGGAGDALSLDPECPLCGPAQRTVAAARAAAAAGRGRDDAFFSSLKAAPDGFDAVADWVGRGLLSTGR